MEVDEAEQDEMEYMEDAITADEAEYNMMQEHKKQMAKVSYFKKINNLNDSWCFAELAIFSCIILGVIQPLFGRIFGDQVYVMSQDYTQWGVEYKQVEVPAYFVE